MSVLNRLFGLRRAVGLMALLTGLIGNSHAQAPDPLPSWNDGAAKARILAFVKAVTEPGLRRRCPTAPPGSRCGAVSFVQRFGSALNAHTHLHCCVTDGVFSLAPADTLQFHPAVDLAEATISAVQRRIRSRVLRLAVRHGALTPDVAADLARWGHGGGFSLHASVLIEAADRAGLERLLRYCVRPARPL